MKKYIFDKYLYYTHTHIYMLKFCETSVCLMIYLDFQNDIRKDSYVMFGYYSSRASTLVWRKF